MATPYERQHGGATAQPFAGANAGAFGAAVGEGIEQAGVTVDRIREREKERRADEEAAAAGVDLATFSSEIETLATDKRGEAAEGAAGHSDGLLVSVDEGINARLERIKDPRVRMVMQQRYAAMRGQLKDREYAWEKGKSIEWQLGNLQQSAKANAAAVAANPTPEGLELALGNNQATWDATQGIDGNTRRKGLEETNREIVVGYGNAMQVKDPGLLVQLLEKSALPHLTADDINTLRSGAMVEIRRGEALAERQRNEAEAQAREKISIFRKGIALGNQPDDSELDGLIAEATRLGLNEQVADLTGDRVKLGINRETRDFTPLQWDNAINPLEAKGDKRNAAEDIRLAQLKAIRATRVAQFNADPHAAAALAGNPPPPLTDVPARVAWAQGQAKSAGLASPPYLSPAEMQPFRDTMQKGMVGTIEVAREIRGKFGVRVGQQVLRQIDAGNADAQLLVGLPPVTAESVAIGTRALEQNAKLAPNASANEVFAEYRGAIPDEIEDSVFRAAKAITARFAAGNGVTTWEDNDEAFRDAFRIGIQRAGGMVTEGGEHKGGFIRWNGRYAVLPQDMSRDDFQRRMSRASADPARFVAAGGGKPHFRGGDGKLKPLTAEQARYLGKYELNTVAPGIYRLRGPAGGELLDANGRPWLLNVRKLP